MPARYVLALKGRGGEETAHAWAESHAAAAGVPVIRVHVSTGDDADFAHPEPHRTTDVVLPRGPVPEQLARFLQDDDALVISTGKTGFIHSRVFGTMSLRIAAVARCAVVVVPHLDLRFRSGVVAGVKADDLLDPVVRAASDEAARRGEPLQVVHSSFSGIVPAPVETSASALEQAAALVQRLHPRATLRTRETVRPPAEALLDASRNAALVVIGAGHAHRSEHSLGPVVQDVLVNINAPVLIVPGDRAHHSG
ncbi:hypothetical protein ASD13_08535 [Microbacterium sp. Root1433D1]|uniref:universal stress protein n=1 Tax=Microbacterium sp. Root1433D1 TaxID=1736463 RepID=UPI000701983F|nr:universal stress protein [Microbacterium sp. Root1433D1]KQY76239.1 hypothetical protein ASD13_08535 [Microbacterium sp. Root1433D1]